MELGAQEYSLQGTMRFLQSEWARHERDRNAWEIERVEMKSRIGKLEGEHRAHERLKEVYLRRIKMLEAALHPKGGAFQANHTEALSRDAKVSPSPSPPSTLEDVKATQMETDRRKHNLGKTLEEISYILSCPPYNPPLPPPPPLRPHHETIPNELIEPDEVEHVNHRFDAYGRIEETNGAPSETGAWNVEDSERHKEESVEWKAKHVLRGHLDTLRSLCWTDKKLYSAGDDSVVKSWSFNDPWQPQVVSVGRGHRGIITCMTDTDSHGVVSAGEDGALRTWDDRYSASQTLEGHSDAVWSLASTSSGIVLSASADKTVKVWDLSAASPLIATWPTDSVPTSIALLNPSQAIVGFADSSVSLWDVGQSRQILRFQSEETYDGTRATSVNCVAGACDLVISGHEDRYIRLFDTQSGGCTYTMLAHLDSVSSLSIAPDLGTFASGGHDASLRVWDLQSRTCLQEITSHRIKAGEGVCCVKYSPSGRELASCGGDGVAKVYTRPG